MDVADVRSFISSNMLDAHIVELAPESTKTSALAAASLGCTVAEIAKSIAFGYVAGGKEKTVVAVLSGDKKVDTAKLKRLLGAEKMHIMDPEEVKEKTGYVIGGVPPFPHKEGITVMADKSLLRFQYVWAAAGASNAVMKIRPKLLSEKLHIQFDDISVKS
ncbi:MAG: YbaK/EbsC family protein [Candidatus Micrarchaeaceae archaeon]